MVSSKVFFCILSLLMVSFVWSNPPAGSRSKKSSAATRAPSPVTQGEIYSQLSEMNDLCEKVLDCVTEYEIKQQKSPDQEPSESLLLEQRCNLMKASCLTILYVADAAKKAAFMQLAELAESART